MNHRKVLPEMTSLILVLVLLVACGTPQTAPTPVPSTSTPTPVPPTATFTPSPPTATPIPESIINGRVFLMDRDEPVHTTVHLVRREGSSDADSEAIETDEDGYYSFLVEEPGTYVIRVSATDLLDKCNKLRTESGWPVAVQTFNQQGILDTLAQSDPITIAIGDEITLDCELYCD